MRYLIVAVMATGLTTPAHSHPSPADIAWGWENPHADTSCGIVWGPVIQLSPDSFAGVEANPSLAVQGDTVHVTWGTSDYKFPYRRSVDNGESFEPLRELRSDSGVVERSRFLATSNFLAGFFIHQDSVRIMRSTDRGDTWDQPNAVTSSWAANGTESIAGKGDTLFHIDLAGPGWRVLRSFDAGQSWNPVGRLLPGSRNTLAITDSILHEVHRFRYDSAGQVGDLVVQYIRSTDWGETWSDSIALSTVATQVAGECFIASDVTQTGPALITAWKDAKYGCLVWGGCAILGRASHTAGTDWGPEQRLDQQPSGTRPIAVLSAGKIVVVWTDYLDPTVPQVMLALSVDGGTTWCGPSAVATGSIPHIAIQGLNVHVAWNLLIGGHNGIYKTYYKKGRIVLNDVQGPRSLPSSFTVFQNYPNPFNATTQIEYDVASAGWVTGRVYNILGQEMRELLNDRKNAGAHSVTWDASTAPSGVYFYRFVYTTDGREVHTFVRPMILLR